MNGFIRIFREDFPGHLGRPGFQGGSLPRRLAQALLDPEVGGFSYSLASSMSPTKGYMVSIYKEREYVVPTPVADLKGKSGEERLLDEIHGFAKRNTDKTKLKNHYLGGWVEDGMAFLDVSVCTTKEADARAFAVRHQQLGYFDIKEKVTIYV